ncbi:hypothetical protein CLOM_g19155 [Closterium sp. NIES-68]|nr:hypothetical protein CLOM_g19155 [Closterium sp. NIES-68]
MAHIEDLPAISGEFWCALAWAAAQSPTASRHHVHPLTARNAAAAAATETSASSTAYAAGAGAAAGTTVMRHHDDRADACPAWEVADSDLDFILELDERWGDLAASQSDGAAASNDAADREGSGEIRENGESGGRLRRSSSCTSSVASSDGGAVAGGSGTMRFDYASEVTSTRPRKHPEGSFDLFPSLVPQSPSTGFELASATESPFKRQRRELVPSVTDLAVDLWLAEAASALRRRTELTSYSQVVRGTVEEMSRSSYVAELEAEIAAMVPAELDQMDMDIILDLDACHDH